MLTLILFLVDVCLFIAIFVLGGDFTNYYLIVPAFIITIWLAIRVFRKLLESYYNLKEALKAKKRPADCHYSDGIVYNKETGELEETSSQILPFDN